VAAQVAATIVVAWFVVRTLVGQWRAVHGQPVNVHPNWLVIAASAGVVLGAYAVLIEAWRRILVAWGASLEFWPAARIMSISRLGLYVPGRVWQITAMAGMAKTAKVNVSAAAGSAILNTIVNIAMGFLVALVAGWRSFGAISQGRTGLGVVLLVFVLGSILLLPTALPFILDAARKVTGKDVPEVSLPHRAVYWAIVANIVAWLLYGAAFELFMKGMTASAPGAYADYVTAFAWPYLVGYLALIMPGGVGVREVALAAALGVMGLATPATAAVIAVSSRLWLSVLEVVPGLLFWLFTRGRSRPTTT
jgi:hypothetical protein